MIFVGLLQLQMSWVSPILRCAGIVFTVKIRRMAFKSCCYSGGIANLQKEANVIISCSYLASILTAESRQRPHDFYSKPRFTLVTSAQSTQKSINVCSGLK